MLRRLKISEIYYISFLFTGIMTLFSVGFFHPDEQYYAIDFAAFKAGILPVIETWEFETELRPWALPLLFTPFLSVGKLFDLSPFGQTMGLRLISALFSFYALREFLKKSKIIFKSIDTYFFFLLFAHFTFFMKFFSVRTNSENWATAFFIYGFSFLFSKTRTNREQLISTLLLGASFLMRHQMGFMILGLGLHLLVIEKMKISRWVLLFVLPIIGIFVLELVIDSWGYNHLSFSPYHYVYQNLILGKVNQFGTHPAWFYFTRSLQKTGPFGLFFFGSIFYFLKNKRKDVLLWCTLPFLLIHHLVGHKELRFLFPIAPFLLLMCFIWFEEKKYLENKKFLTGLKVVFTFNFVLLTFISFKPAYSPLGFYKALYESKVRDLQFYSREGRVEPRLELNFYMRKELKVEKLKGDLKFGTGWIWTSKYRDLEELWERKDCSVEFSTYPKWVLGFNIGNWRERSNIWALSRCGFKD